MKIGATGTEPVMTNNMHPPGGRGQNALRPLMNTLSNDQRSYVREKLDSFSDGQRFALKEKLDDLKPQAKDMTEDEIASAFLNFVEEIAANSAEYSSLQPQKAEGTFGKGGHHQIKHLMNTLSEDQRSIVKEKLDSLTQDQKLQLKDKLDELKPKAKEMSKDEIASAFTGILDEIFSGGVENNSGIVDSYI